MNARDTVRPNDSMITLATRLLGSPMRWRELVALNALKPPYLTPDGAGGTLRPGDQIIYPAQPGTSAPRNLAQLEVDAYRRDAATTRRGDLILQGGDLATHAGLPNLREALLTRVRTQLGGHPFHPGYGSRVKGHVGQVGDGARLNMAVNDVLRAVLQDPRVQSATGEAVLSGDVMTLDLWVTPVPPGTPFSLRVPLAGS